MKKRFMTMLLALTMCLTLLPAAALAADSGFTIEDGILTQYKGPGGAVTIPNGITVIGRSAFEGCTNLTSVDIPDSVTSIGISAFSGCTGLTDVTIPDSVTEIEWYAFYGCTGLTNVAISDSVTKIGVGAFSGCTGLTGVSIGSGVTSIDDEAFMDCASLNRVSIPDSVTEIGSFAFSGCTGLTSVSIGSSVTEIRWSAFADCTGLTSVVIPDGVTSIDLSTFNGCSGLTSVTIPSSVTEIKFYAFFGCSGLRDVYYGGSEAQWNAIKIEFENDDPFLSAAIHYNSTGPDRPVTPDQPSNLPTVEPIPAVGTAVARTQTVKLDGKDVEFQCYAVRNTEGNETNYVKLRDLAQVLNGTNAQFDVGWDGQISITPHTPYQAAGGEGTTPYSGDQPYEAASDTPVRFDGSAVNLTSFIITCQGGGYTYYKLRDLGQLLDFNVMWDGSGIVVEPDKPYTG